MKTALLAAVALVPAVCDPISRETRPGDTPPCDPASCGPVLGLPNWLCPDGTVGGPTGRCLRRTDGSCGWEILDCPPTRRCGTIAGLVCPAGLVCVDAPGGGCVYPIDPDCGGVCVVPVFCGGIAGFPCPAGRVCVDDPRDDCWPGRGADCGGLCAPGFCGFSTGGRCQTDADCSRQGCSAQACAARFENVVTTCEWRECYDPGPSGAICGCGDGGCSWR